MAVATQRAEEAAPVLVLQAGLRSGPWTCRSLARGGYRVLAGHELGGPPLAARTRHADLVLHYPSPRDRPDDFLAWVDRTCREHSVRAVLPLSETTVHLLAERLPEPGGALLIGPTMAQYARVCDKAALAEVTRPLGIETPPGTFVSETGPVGDWPSLPSIVKPPASATPTRTGVVYAPAALVSTSEQRSEAVERLIRDCGGALVQEVIHGLRVRFHFVSHREGLSAMAFETVRSYPAVTGMSSVSRSIPTPPEVMEATARLVKLVDYRGPGSTQFIRRDGRTYLHDVNLRLAYSTGAEVGAGFDSPRLCVDDALGRSFAAPAHAGRTGSQYVWLGGEVQALVDGLRGRPAAAPVRTIARDLVVAAVSPRRILDPFSLSDPLPTLGVVADALQRLGRKRRRKEVAS